MAARAFDCPHCGGTFRVAPTSLPKAVACPHCQKKVTIAVTDSSRPAASTSTPAAPPVDQSPVDPTSFDALGESPPSEPAATGAEALPFDPFEVDAEEASSLASRRGRRQRAAAPQRVVRPLTRQERARRQRIRSTIVMLFCAAVLFAAVVLLSRR